MLRRPRKLVNPMVVIVTALSLSASRAQGRDIALATKDGFHIEFSPTGRVMECRVGQTALALTESGGFSLLDFGAETQGENLVPNPSFEEGVRGWSLAATQQLDTSVPHSGKAAVRLCVPGPEPGSSNLGVRLAVKGDTLYHLGVWMRRQNCGVCSAYFSEYDAEGKLSAGVTQVGLGAPKNDGEWKFQGRAIRTAPKTISLLLRADIYRSTGTLWLDDFTVIEIGKSRFKPVAGRVRTARGQVLFESDLPEARLKLRADWQPKPEYLRADCEVEDTSGEDRALGVSFRLPFDADGWTWWDDIAEHRTVHDPGSYSFTYSCESGEGLCSVYPFAALTTSSSALSWGLPLSQGPRVFLTGYDNSEKVAFINFYLGLSKETAKVPQRAGFSFLLYRSDPRWGLRSTVEHYYRFFAESFVKRSTYEGYLNYANLEPFDALTHRLMVKPDSPGAAPEGLEDASDFGEGYRFLWHMHGCYDFRMLATEDTKMPSDETVLQFLRDLAAKEDPSKAWYVPNSETLKKLTYDAEGHIRYIGDTQYWQPHQGYNHTDKPGWGLNFRVNEDAAVSGHLANKTREVLEKYTAEPGRRDWSACLTADAIEGYFGNTGGLNCRREHFRSMTFPLTFGKDSFKVAMPNTIWDFHNSVWWPLTQQHRVVTYGNANGYEQAFTLPFCDVPMIEWDWDTARPGRFERYLRTMAYHKIWRFWRVCGKGEEDLESVLAHLRRGLAYAVFPSVWGVQTVAGNLEDYRALYRQCVPIMEELSSAGWEPVPHVRCSDESVVVERFGSLKAGDLHFTLRNYASEEKQVSLTLDLPRLGFVAADAKRLLVRDLLANRLLDSQTKGGAATMQVSVAANGSAALRVGTPLTLARYAFHRVAAGLERVERVFATDLTDQNRAMIADGLRVIGSLRPEERALLAASDSLHRLLDRLEPAIATKAAVDKAKVFSRIRRDLGDVARGLLDIELEAPPVVEAVQGDAAEVKLSLTNRSATHFSGVALAMRSPWESVASASKVSGLPAALPPGALITMTLNLSIPTKPERPLLPFLIEVKAMKQQPVMVATMMDVHVVPALAVEPASDRAYLGRPATLRLKLQNRCKRRTQVSTEARATLRLKPPAGCTVEPKERAVAVPPGEAQEVQFALTFSDSTRPGVVELGVEVASGDARFQRFEKVRVKLLSPVPRVAVRRAFQPPKLEGKLDDAVWQGPPTIPALVELRSGKPVSQSTAFWLTYDEKGLYAAFRCAESDMSKLRAAMTQRGSPIYQEDDVEIFLLPPGSGGATQLAVSPLGTQNDNIGNDKPWLAVAQKAEGEWTVEMFVPYLVLGVKAAPKPGDVWRAQVGRQQKPKGEVSAWTTSATGFSNVERFGELAFE